jgi:hypothetical protein
MNRQLRPRLDRLEARAIPSNLAVSLVTNHRLYRPGQVVCMKLTEKNVSGQDVILDWGPSIAGFSIMRNGVCLWRSYSGIMPLFIAERTLAPGQSMRMMARWKAANAPGTYVVSSQMVPAGPVARFRIVSR